MFRRRLARFVAIALLAWIGIDLAGIDTCALDVDAKGPAAETSAAAWTPSGGSHPPGPLHVDHCICHSQSIEPGIPTSLEAPAAFSHDIPDPLTAHPHSLAASLYHPPQRLS